MMGTGLATSTQLQAFRESLGTFGTVQTVWMSATLLPGWLASIDYRDRIEPAMRLRTLALDPTADLQADGLRERWNAGKPLSPAGVSADDPASVAQLVTDHHQPGSLTLVIVNKVDRAPRPVRGDSSPLRAAEAERPGEIDRGERADTLARLEVGPLSIPSERACVVAGLADAG